MSDEPKNHQTDFHESVDTVHTGTGNIYRITQNYYNQPSPLSTDRPSDNEIEAPKPPPTPVIVTPIEATVGSLQVTLDKGDDGLFLQAMNKGRRKLRQVNLTIHPSTSVRVTEGVFRLGSIPAGASSDAHRLGLRVEPTSAQNASGVYELKFDAVYIASTKERWTGVFRIALTQRQ